MHECLRGIGGRKRRDVFSLHNYHQGGRGGGMGWRGFPFKDAGMFKGDRGKQETGYPLITYLSSGGAQARVDKAAKEESVSATEPAPACVRRAPTTSCR